MKIAQALELQRGSVVKNSVELRNKKLITCKRDRKALLLLELQVLRILPKIDEVLSVSSARKLCRLDLGLCCTELSYSTRIDT